MGMCTLNKWSARSFEGRPAGWSGNPRNASPKTPGRGSTACACDAEGGYARAYGVDQADAFVPENPARLASWDVSLQDVQICAANRGLRDLHNCVAGRPEIGLLTFFKSFLARAMVDK